MRTRALLTSLMVPAATVAIAAITSAAPVSATTPASTQLHASASIVLPQGVLGGQYTCHAMAGDYASTSYSWSCSYSTAGASASAVETLGLLCADGTTTYTTDRAHFSCGRVDVATG